MGGGLTFCAGALVNSSLPAVLVATKCDNSDPSKQIDTEAVAATCQSCLATFKTSSSKPETARMSLFTLLKALVLKGQGKWKMPFYLFVSGWISRGAGCDFKSDANFSRPRKPRWDGTEAASSLCGPP